MVHKAVIQYRKGVRIVYEGDGNGLVLACQWPAYGLYSSLIAYSFMAIAIAFTGYANPAALPLVTCAMHIPCLFSIMINALTEPRLVIDYLTFKKSKTMAKKKSPLSGRVKTAPEYERTRENMAEFGRAGKASNLLRSAFRELLLTGADKKVYERLTTRFMKVLAADSINGRGDRTVGNGEADLLRNFNFNKRMHLANVFFVREKITIDRATGLVTIDVPGFTPQTKVLAPLKTTHFAVTVAATAIDFDNEVYDQAIATTEDMVLNSIPVQGKTLQLQLPANSTYPIIVALGIEFFQQVNGRMSPLKSGKHNSAAIVKISKP